MNLQTLLFFVTSADTGSFSAASEKLHYAQSNLSSRMKQLEEEIGEALFYRDKKGVSLTAKGRLFYEYAEKILSLSEEAVRCLQDADHPRGYLQIGSIEATALKDLPEVLSAYHRNYPDVKLSLQIDMNDVFEGLVLHRSLDGAFVTGPVSHPDLTEISFCRERLVLVGEAGHPDLQSDKILETAPLITFPGGSAFRRRFELLLTSKKISYSDRLVVMNSLGAMIANICAGIGYGYLPESVARPYIDRNVMRSFPLEDPYSGLEVVFIYRTDHVMDAAFRCFLQQINPRTIAGDTTNQGTVS